MTQSGRLRINPTSHLDIALAHLRIGPVPEEDGCLFDYLGSDFDTSDAAIITITNSRVVAVIGILTISVDNGDPPPIVDGDLNWTLKQTSTGDVLPFLSTYQATIPPGTFDISLNFDSPASWRVDVIGVKNAHVGVVNTFTNEAAADTLHINIVSGNTFNDDNTIYVVGLFDAGTPDITDYEEISTPGSLFSHWKLSPIEAVDWSVPGAGYIVSVAWEIDCGNHGFPPEDPGGGTTIASRLIPQRSFISTGQSGNFGYLNQGGTDDRVLNDTGQPQLLFIVATQENPEFNYAGDLAASTTLIDSGTYGDGVGWEFRSVLVPTGVHSLYLLGNSSGTSAALWYGFFMYAASGLTLTVETAEAFAGDASSPTIAAGSYTPDVDQALYTVFYNAPSVGSAESPFNQIFATSGNLVTAPWVAASWLADGSLVSVVWDIATPIVDYLITNITVSEA